MERKEKTFRDELYRVCRLCNFLPPKVLEDKLVYFVNRELSKAREEGYQDCIDDIWEEARGVRSWTEHDGNVSVTDVEAGLQEAYLNIVSKLKEK